MIISWYGEGCFKIQNGDKVIMTDTPTKDSGISKPRVKADILLKTITAWPIKEEKNGYGVIVYGAGEYDIEGIKIRGMQISDESDKNFFKTVYILNWDDVTIGILGTISNIITKPEIVENFEDIDILIAPGGGNPFISQKDVSKFIKQLNPKIFIPSFYKIKGLKRKTEEITPLLNEFNGEVEKDLEKLVIKKKDINEIKKTKVICLKA